MSSAPTPDAARTATRIVAAAALLAYPAIVYFAAGSATPAALAGVLASALLLRAFAAGADSAWHAWRWPLVAAAALVLLSVVLVDDILPLRAYPVAANAVGCLAFSLSLFSRQPLVERIARATDGPLTPPAVRYTRRVTQVWAAFLAVNTAISAYTALWASLATWALWNGLIAYVLMGTLFGVEYLVRRRVRPTWNMP